MCVLYLLLSFLLALYVISRQGWSARRVQRPRGFHPWSLLAAEGKIASPERQLGFLWQYAEFYMDGGVVTTALLLLAVGWSCAAAQQLASAQARCPAACLGSCTLSQVQHIRIQA